MNNFKNVETGEIETIQELADGNYFITYVFGKHNDPIKNLISPEEFKQKWEEIND